MCINYSFKLHHILIPQLEIFRKVCESYDKTDLFIVSLVRLLIIIALYSILNNKINNKNIKFGFFIYGAINLTLLIMIFFKKQKQEKIEKKPILSESNDLL